MKFCANITIAHLTKNGNSSEFKPAVLTTCTLYKLKNLLY